jgi:hypothetical protein
MLSKIIWDGLFAWISQTWNFFCELNVYSANSEKTENHCHLKLHVISMVDVFVT